MEILDRDILNLIDQFETEVSRSETEEQAFEQAIRQWETDGVFDDIFGG